MKLYLKNVEQVALFRLEIAGQISDGHWENAGPRDHWKDWCNCETVIAGPGQQVGRDFYTARDKYGLTSPQLLSVVGGRMIGQVILARALGFQAAEELESLVECMDDFKIGFMDPFVVEDSSHYAKFRGAVEKHGGIARIKSLFSSPSYGKKELLSDLREISRAMRTPVSAAGSFHSPESVA